MVLDEVIRKRVYRGSGALVLESGIGVRPRSLSLQIQKAGDSSRDTLDHEIRARRPDGLRRFARRFRVLSGVSGELGLDFDYASPPTAIRPHACELTFEARLAACRGTRTLSIRRGERKRCNDESQKDRP
jgi:hypothetical protein